MTSAIPSWITSGTGLNAPRSRLGSRLLAGHRASKFYDWRSRYGLVNEHNAHIPRDWWLEDWEKKAIIAFHLAHCLEGYRRLTFMMLDADVVAVSASSVYRVLRDAGLMERHNVKPSKKGKGFEQPLRPHEHWHVDVSYINVAGTYFFLCSLLDGCSRLIVHWEIREQMTEADVETIIQRARAVPRRPSADHLGQWTAVHCQGLQGVHPHLRHDSREDIAILSAEQWQDRALAPLGQDRVHPPRHAAVAGGRPATGRGLRAALQRGPLAQCDRLYYTGRQVGRA